MILRGWHIESYGVFADWTLDDLGAGITLFHGPNEAGKSTLLHFLRGALFGYPTRRQAGYVPHLSESGLHGGRVFLEEDTGRWTLERLVRGKKVTLTRPDGTPAEPADLDPLLHHADKTLFQSVFTFQLSDLTGLEGDDAQKVRDRLFSAGISGAGKSASELVARLGGEMETLYKKKGSTQKLKLILTRLGEEQTRCKELVARADGYHQNKHRLEELAQRATTLKTERDQQVTRRETLEQLEKLWPLLRKHQTVEELLTRLGAPATFPAQGIARLEKLLEQRDGADLARQKLERKRDDLSARRDALNLDPALLARGDVARHLAQSLPAHVERQNQLRELKRSNAAAAGNLQQTLQELGVRWTRAMVREVDTGAERNDALQRLGSEFSRAAGELAFAQREERERPAATTATTPRWLLPVALMTGGGLAVLGFAWEQPPRYALWAAGALVAAIGLLFCRPSQSAASARSTPTALETAQTGFAQAQSAWALALQDWGLSTGDPLSPDTAVHLLTRLGGAQREEADLAQKERAAETLREELLRWEAEAISALGLDSSLSGEALANGVRDAIATIEKEQAQHAEAQTLAGQLREREEELAELLDQARFAEGKLAELYREAGVATEEVFRKSADLYDQKSRLDEQQRTLSAQIVNLTGEGDWAKAMLERAAEGTVARWAADKQEAADNHARLEREFAEVNQELGGLRHEMGELETSTQLAQCRARIEGLHAEADALARRWRVAALTRALVRTTLDEYAARNQPEALARASQLFETLTGGRYTRVVHAPDEDELLAIRATGEQLTADQLSRGTREGLYICLRLALAAQHNQRQGHLPLVMDDVLVNLDPGRAEAALAALAEFAKDNQVLLFTCHPETVARVQKVAPDARLVELPGPKTPAP